MTLNELIKSATSFYNLSLVVQILVNIINIAPIKIAIASPPAITFCQSTLSILFLNSFDTALTLPHFHQGVTEFYIYFLIAGSRAYLYVHSVTYLNKLILKYQ